MRNGHLSNGHQHLCREATVGQTAKGGLIRLPPVIHFF